MKATLVITTYQKIKFSFLLEDGKLVEAHPFQDSSILGNVYTASVMKVIPSIDAAFLDAGTGDTLYYPIAENAENVAYSRHGKKNHPCAGDCMIVQVSREAMKTKKASCTSDIILTGEYVVVNRTGKFGISKKISEYDDRKNWKDSITALPEYNKFHEKWNSGIIVRTAAAFADYKKVIGETINLLCKQNEIIESGLHEVSKKCLYQNIDSEKGFQKIVRDNLAKKKYESFEVVTNIQDVYQNLVNMKKQIGSEFSLEFTKSDDIDITYKIGSQIGKLLQRKIYLKSGGYLVVDQTEALTAIDVNSGKFITGSSTEKHYQKTNIEAAEMIARLLRLRNISGMILIDFINMKDLETVRTVTTRLKECISNDPVRTIFVDMTGLGLAELTRQKIEKPLSEILLT